ncbi:hypothetical protein B0H63DRAFT_559599 [Podospora didyma]|uniref:Uncharacterized protein n=1 Tax=Podospora didyma TaxID=330526 RepID=A0AAE0TZ15_9PEZI|nr:hypothetical protein B0H63DRAFT_559599 [Podospora didyma]
MSGPNIFVSNGTCYTAPGKELDKSFIPCGNAAFGHKTCCGGGDNCLADGSCFGVHGSGYGSYLTYMAGCTDSEYKDASCPNKHIDQPWVALTLCKANDGVWAVCSQIGNPSTLQPGASCSCTSAATATVAFTDANVLTSSCSLPQSTGQSIQFFTGHIPTSPPPPAATTAPGASPSTGSSPGSATAPPQTGSPPSSSGPAAGTTAPPTSGGSIPISSSPQQSGTSSPSSNDNNNNNNNSSDPSSGGLSSSAKAGIIGGVVGGVILLAALAVLFFLRRRRQRPSGSASGKLETGASGGKKQKKHQQRFSDISTPTNASEADGQAVSEADGKAARPWSMRSELEGSQVSSNMSEHQQRLSSSSGGDAHGWRPRKSGELSPVAELPG